MPGLTIEVKGRTYRGVWFQHAPGTIELRSEYGASQAYLDGRDPELVAIDVLKDIVGRFTAADARPG